MIGRMTMHAGALLLGVVVGAGLVLASGTAPGDPGTPTPSPTASPTQAPGTTASDDPTALPQTTGALLLAWTAGGLPEGFATGVAEVQGVREVTEVVAGRLDLRNSTNSHGTVVDQPPPGWAIPLDAIAIDPGTFTPFVPTGERPTFQRLEPGTVILGETSAALRNLDVGGQLTIGADGGHSIVGIVDDATVGAAEIVLHRSDALARRMTPQYLLLRYDDQRLSVEAAVRGVAGSDPVRIRAPGETPYLRHGDAVLPQAIVKRRYGEFSYRPPAAGDLAFEIDGAWVDENIVTRELAILGSVTCHRASIESLEGLLADLDRRGLAHTVDPDGFAGCWYPRLISTGGELSRHAWGIAVDVNAKGNPTGTGSGQDPALVESFTEAGWGWGGTWLVPDPMHFELVDDGAVPVKVQP